MPNAKQVREIKRLLSLCTAEQRREVFGLLRAEFHIHPLESKLNATAELILEAIDRSSDLVQRGVRGVIAEAAFKLYVLQELKGWTSQDLSDDYPYDFKLTDKLGDVRIQVKMQRLRARVPMTANKGYSYLPSDMFVVETQRTRAGKDQSGQDTRPYKFGEFDVLAVSMHPSTRDWSRFFFTVERWLLPRPASPALLLKFQPVPRAPNDCWTDKLLTAVEWFRSGINRRII
jgi:hypothetical protein